MSRVAFTKCICMYVIQLIFELSRRRHSSQATFCSFGAACSREGGRKLESGGDTLPESKKEEARTFCHVLPVLFEKPHVL